jgi:hypothetical protein
MPPPAHSRAGVPRGALIQALPTTSVVNFARAIDPLFPAWRPSSVTRSVASLSVSLKPSSESFNLTRPALSVNPSPIRLFSTSPSPARPANSFNLPELDRIVKGLNPSVYWPLAAPPPFGRQP